MTLLDVFHYLRQYWALFITNDENHHTLFRDPLFQEKVFLREIRIKCADRCTVLCKNISKSSIFRCQTLCRLLALCAFLPLCPLHVSLLSRAVSTFPRYAAPATDQAALSTNSIASGLWLRSMCSICSYRLNLRYGFY